MSVKNLSLVVCVLMMLAAVVIILQSSDSLPASLSNTTGKASSMQAGRYGYQNCSSTCVPMGTTGNYSTPASCMIAWHKQCDAKMSSSMRYQ